MNCSDIYFLLPIIIISLAAMLLLVLEVSPLRSYKELPASVAFWGFLLAMVFAVNPQLGCASVVPITSIDPLKIEFKVFCNGLMYRDQFAWVFSFLIMLCSSVVVLFGDRALERDNAKVGPEFYSLLMMASAGAIIFVSAAELITMFLALEIMSLALYCLCGSAITGATQKVRRSAESALKYFLLGSFGSAFFLYGIALVYGLTGTTYIYEAAELIADSHQQLRLIAIGMIVFGVGFKLALAPFHFWAPDVYQGAPTTVTAFMASVVKASAVCVAARIFWGLFGTQIIFWSGAVWLMSLLSMCVGNFLALKQRSLKRMLAYSSIAHAGVMMMAILAPGATLGGGPALIFYIFSYAVVAIGTFALISAVSGVNGDDDIRVLEGLAKRDPLQAAFLSLFLLTLAGIPPGVLGLISKFYIISSTVKAGYLGLAVVAGLNSAVAVYYYLRPIVFMYFKEQSEHGSQMVSVSASGQASGFLAQEASWKACVVLCAVAVLVLGIFPAVLFQGAQVVMASF